MVLISSYVYSMKKQLQKSYIPKHENISNPEVRARYGYLEAYVSIIGNIGLFLLKLLMGLFINSIALIADGVHSLSDTCTSVVVIYGFKSAKKKPDKEHPFGHGRAEHIATLVIAIILAIVGVLFIQESLGRIWNLENLSNVEYVFVIVAVVLFSAVVKELMARFSYRLSKKIKSDVLVADAWNHRSDALSSVGVAIGLIGARYGYLILDPIFGIVVAIIIIYVGVDLLRKSSNFLLGTSPTSDLISELNKIANQIDGILDIHEIYLHDYGTTKVVTLHANVNQGLPIEDAHQIAEAIETMIKERTGYLSIIHIEPAKGTTTSDLKDWVIEQILQNQKEIISFHKINIIKIKNKFYIRMHLMVDKDMSVEATHELNHRLEHLINKEYHNCEINIHFDPCIHHCNECDIYCTERTRDSV